MTSKVNLKARIERHSRILKENFISIKPFKNNYHNFNYNIVIFIIIVLFPIYPLFSYYIYDSSALDFYRWNIDETSIIEHYIDDSDDWSYLITTDDSFLSVNTISGWKREIATNKNIIDYEVKSWDNLSSIAKNFEISTDSILWSNNLDKNSVLKVWSILKIPTISWIVYKVKSWDTIWELALKYSVDQKEIYDKNSIYSENWLKIWKYIIIPWWIVPKNVIIEEPESPKNTQKLAQNKVTKTEKNSKAKPTQKVEKWINTKKIASKVYTEKVYEIKKRVPKWSFAWGNCTWYVAQYKDVNWSWNAKDWLYNASAKWHSTWSTPAVWSIIVFNGLWYNPRYWHVWIVIDIVDDELIIKDMNYRRLNEVTVRKVDKNDRSIKWYIYVD